jgi:hypothetical protein
MRASRMLPRRGSQWRARAGILTHAHAHAFAFAAALRTVRTTGRVAARALPPPLAARPGARGAAGGGARAGARGRGEVRPEGARRAQCAARSFMFSSCSCAPRAAAPSPPGATLGPRRTHALLRRRLVPGR